MSAVFYMLYLDELYNEIKLIIHLFTMILMKGINHCLINKQYSALGNNYYLYNKNKYSFNNISNEFIVSSIEEAWNNIILSINLSVNSNISNINSNLTYNINILSNINVNTTNQLKIPKLFSQNIFQINLNINCIQSYQCIAIIKNRFIWLNQVNDQILLKLSISSLCF